MPKARWKLLQEEIARLLEAQRLPLNPSAPPHLESDALIAVVRLRASCPQWLRSDMARARAKADVAQTPMVILTTGLTEMYAIIPLDGRFFLTR